MTLTEFLLARIAEDEGRLVHDFDCDRFQVYDYGTRQGDCDCLATRRLLAECEAKRADRGAPRTLRRRVRAPDSVDARVRLLRPPGLRPGMEAMTTQPITQGPSRERFPFAAAADFRAAWAGLPVTSEQERYLRWLEDQDQPTLNALADVIRLARAERA